MKLTPEMIEAAADELRRIKANGLNPASYIAAQSALYAAIAAIDAAGFVIAPKEPTPEMIAAGWIDKEDVNPDDIYCAMINAIVALKEPKSD
jgi:hypothetical protein